LNSKGYIISLIGIINPIDGIEFVNFSGLIEKQVRNLRDVKYIAIKVDNNYPKPFIDIQIYLFHCPYDKEINK